MAKTQLVTKYHLHVNVTRVLSDDVETRSWMHFVGTADTPEAIGPALLAERARVQATESGPVMVDFAITPIQVRIPK